MALTLTLAALAMAVSSQPLAGDGRVSVLEEIRQLTWVHLQFTGARNLLAPVMGSVYVLQRSVDLASESPFLAVPGTFREQRGLFLFTRDRDAKPLFVPLFRRGRPLVSFSSFGPEAGRRAFLRIEGAAGLGSFAASVQAPKGESEFSLFVHAEKNGGRDPMDGPVFQGNRSYPQEDRSGIDALRALKTALLRTLESFFPPARSDDLCAFWKLTSAERLLGEDGGGGAVTYCLDHVSDPGIRETCARLKRALLARPGDSKACNTTEPFLTQVKGAPRT
ncbi:MAG: hypothetical protein V1798_08985 [Pseudomonadota bacterium]